MEDKDTRELNWTALFVVTACSTFIFSLIIKILDGDFSILLLLIAAVTGVLSLLSWFLSVLSAYNSKNHAHAESFTTDMNPD